MNQIKPIIFIFVAGAMRIRKPRGISTIQLMVVTGVGFGAGVYIWKPLFESLRQSKFAAVTTNNEEADNNSSELHNLGAQTTNKSV